MSVFHPALYWLIIGVMMFFLELALPGFILFFFALGALITAGASWMFPSLSIASQLGLFIIASLGMLFGLRNVIQKRFMTKPKKDENNPEEDDPDDTPLAVPGDKGVVCMTIAPPGEGRIKYSGTYWRATADERIEDGEIIQIVQQKGLVIHVEKV